MQIYTMLKNLYGTAVLICKRMLTDFYTHEGQTYRFFSREFHPDFYAIEECWDVFVPCEEDAEFSEALDLAEPWLKV